MLPLLAWFVATYLLVPNLRAYAIGAALGIGVTLYLSLLDEPPDWIKKWERGAEGERQTAKALRRLERAGWTVVHDVQRERGNIDHIAVGPPGVFMIETKNYTGRISVQGEELLIQHTDDGLDEWRNDGVARRARGAAWSLRDRLNSPGARWVQGVVVLWGDFAASEVKTGRVAFLAGDRLPAWLASQPARLSPAQAREVSAAVRALVSDESSSGTRGPAAARLAPQDTR